MRRCFAAVVLLVALFSNPPASNGAFRWPEDETPEERYWKRIHEQEAKQETNEEHRRLAAREKVIAEMGESVEAGNSFQRQIIIAQDGPPPPPPGPSIFKRKGDEILLGTVGIFTTLLTLLTLVRHKREAEIRALSGRYLSDGTEMAHYELPEWFALMGSGDSGFKPETTVAVNASSRDYVLPESVTQFLVEAPALLAKIRDVLKNLFLDLDPAERRKHLESMRELLFDLQSKADCWHLRPAWQMTSALGLLVTRVIEKPKDSTPSVIRTITCALDTLQDLCAPDIRPNLLIEPPIKVLAVDDEPLCCRALQFALHKANLAADVAGSGEQAIQLAENCSYDVVLMDIQMPGIDGLTACRGILAMERNSDVPVIFVTVQSDFSTRAKTRLEGGVDIMAKPYLILELTVKAMTFATRKRLQVAGRGRGESVVSRAKVPVAQVISNDAPVSLTPSSAPESAILIENPELKNADLEGDFFLEIPEFLRSMQRIVEEIRADLAGANVQTKIGDVYLRIHKVTTRAKLLDLPVTEHVSSTLESLLKRLHNNPKTINVSTLNTVAHALKLLKRICVPSLESQLSHYSSVKILVAEDEPLARRAVIGSLQLAFEKPESTEDGAKALRLASEKSYDVIFTDVQMPEMDGFTFCAELRAGGSNQNTPIVFITGINNFEAQARALESGGNDFIVKPFLPIEITVKAMTFAWEGRLRKLSIDSTWNAVSLPNVPPQNDLIPRPLSIESPLAGAPIV